MTLTIQYNNVGDYSMEEEEEDETMLNNSAKIAPARSSTTTPPMSKSSSANRKCKNNESLTMSLHEIEASTKASFKSSNHDSNSKQLNLSRSNRLRQSRQASREKVNQRQERKSSILKSLNILDVDENDDDYHQKQQQQLEGDESDGESSVDSRGSQGPRSRARRRGSVIKSFNAEPSEYSDIESDYGSDYDYGGERQPRRSRYMRRGSVTKYSISSAASQVQPDGHDMIKPRMRLPPPPSNEDDESPRIMRHKSRRASIATTKSDLGRKPSSSADYRRRRASTNTATTTDFNPNALLPGDDDWSGNLDDSGHSLRRFPYSLPPPLPNGQLDDQRSRGNPHVEDGSFEDPPFGNNKKVQSRAHGLMHHKHDSRSSDLETPPATAVAAAASDPKKNNLEEDSSHSLQQHAKKFFPSFHRRDSNSSLESDDASDSEFASESMHVQQTPRRLPPRLPPSSIRSPTPIPRSRPGNSLPSPPMTAKSNNSRSHSPDRKLSTIDPKYIQDLDYSMDTDSFDDETSKVAASATAPAPVSHHRRGASNAPKRNNSLTKAFKKMTSPNASSSSAASVASTASLTSSSTAGSTTTLSPKPKGCLKNCSPTRSAKPKAKLGKQVRFGHLTITEFPIILGDNPAVTSGAPITIDWAPQGEYGFSINAYEQCKPKRRRRRKLLISVSNRAILLLAAGYSIDDIADASINAQQIKFGRQETLRQNPQWDRVNLMMENTNELLGGMMQNTGKKLKALSSFVKPQQHSESARMA